MSATSPAENDDDPRCAGADRILVAARTLFAERGLSGVSIQQIADSAGVSKANVFHHFTSKQALYRAVLEEAAGEFRGLLSTLSEQTTARGLQEFSLQHLTRLLEDRASTWLFLRALSDPHSGTERRLAEEVVRQAMTGLIEAIERLHRSAPCPPGVEAGTLALTLLGSNLVYFQLHTILPELQNPAAFTESVARLLTRTSDKAAPTKKKANQQWD